MNYQSTRDRSAKVSAARAIVQGISHEGGLTSVYCGLGEAASLTEGQYLAAGTQVGTVGICPAEQLEEPHLHFAMKADGQWVDPLATMGKLPQ